VQIKSRKIAVRLNNAWQDMSANDFEVILEAPDNDGICRGTSSLEFVKYMPHNLFALNFKIQYTASLPTKPVPMTVSHTIGWSTFLPSINQQNMAHD